MALTARSPQMVVGRRNVEWERRRVGAEREDRHESEDEEDGATHEPPPVAGPCAAPEKADGAPDDHQEVTDRSDEDEEEGRMREAAASDELEEGLEPPGREAGYEEVGGVPEGGYSEPGAKTPRAVAPGEQDHSSVDDQRLNGVEEPDGGLDEGGEGFSLAFGEWRET